MEVMPEVPLRGRGPSLLRCLAGLITPGFRKRRAGPYREGFAFVAKALTLHVRV